MTVAKMSANKTNINAFMALDSASKCKEEDIKKSRMARETENIEEISRK